MDGILTASGITSWLSGQKKLVKEWDRAIIDNVEVDKVILFSNSAQTRPVAHTLAAAFGNANVMDTSLKREGRFSTDSFTATHLAVELQSITSVGGNAASDLVASTVTDFQEFHNRAWFEMYFTSGNEPHDRGQCLDFPAGRAFAFQGAPVAAATVMTNSITTGLEPKMMRTPYAVNKDTTPRLEISFPRGAIALTEDLGVFGFVLGFTG